MIVEEQTLRVVCDQLQHVRVGLRGRFTDVDPVYQQELDDRLRHAGAALVDVIAMLSLGSPRPSPARVETPSGGGDL